MGRLGEVEGRLGVLLLLLLLLCPPRPGVGVERVEAYAGTEGCGHPAISTV